tara:strand:- start:171207 stop:172391 length:1185 start_codon:yes stop_codon:yes gene_type:complete
MKKIIILLLTAITFSCSSVKKTQEAVNTGNYLTAINRSITKLSENKTKKGNQEYILLLEDAFTKNTTRELKEIDFLKKDGNPANYEKIYNTYLNLNHVQKRIEALLPLRLIDENRNASFKMKNYEDKIVSSKIKLSDYLYTNALNLASNASSKYDYRKAYDDLVYLNKLNPNYKDTRLKIEEVYEKGIDYVRVGLYNDTEIALPERLEEDLLNFNTYGLDDLWTKYHTNPQTGIQYNYEMQLGFNSILISPEQVSEKHILKEKVIKDGWKYDLDANGNVKKDSLGNDIKVDNFTTVKSNFYRLTQHKDVKIVGVVSYYDLNTKQQINSYPLTSGYVFEHMYGSFNGDRRALDTDLLSIAGRKAVPFPTNEQMIYDSAEDLKNNIKGIIMRYKFN